MIDGKGWRSGADVVQKELTQWFFKITDYADSLLEDLATLERWPEKVRTMQANWIGRSEGLQMRFEKPRMVQRDEEGNIPHRPWVDERIFDEFGGSIEIFTTRPDTLFGASFIALSPDHPLTIRLAEGHESDSEDAKALTASKEIQQFRVRCAKIGTSEEAIEKAEKLGIDTGLRVKHPFKDGESLPVYIANFVLMGYGTGAIFGCPAHDQRDLDFARQHDELEVIPVVLPTGEEAATYTIDTEAYTGEGTLFNSGFLDGLGKDEGIRAAIQKIEEMGLGKGTVNYRLRDWGVSRQRYWGCPIPIIKCPSCGMVPVPEADLPVTLPEDCLLYTSPSPRDKRQSRMPSSA